MTFHKPLMKTLIFGISLIFLAGTASLSFAGALELGQPLGDAFDRKQAEITSARGTNAGPEVSGSLNGAFDPQLSDQINEPHPFPEYMKKFAKGDRLPEYYKDLIRAPRKNQIQSIVFDEKAFKDLRRIGVFGFENKTYFPDRDESAGDFVANEMYMGLQGFPKFTVISPPKMQEKAFKMKIVSTPATPAAPQDGFRTTRDQSTGNHFTPQSFTEFKELDAVMIGAVTKYLDSYKDRQGNRVKSYSGGLEFGAFLISARTGKVIWGARYVGSQPRGINLLSVLDPNARPNSLRWLDKKELTREAMKKVVRVFEDAQR